MSFEEMRFIKLIREVRMHIGNAQSIILAHRYQREISPKEKKNREIFSQN